MEKLFNLRAVALICLFGSMISCNGTTFVPTPMETYDFEVTTPDRDSLFVINSTKVPSESIRVTVEGNLSHLAILTLSSDSLFKDISGLAITPGNSNYSMSIVDNFTNKTYMKYRPLYESDSITGNLKIKITIQ